MARKQSKGTCTYCSQAFAKGGMTKHLTTCPQRQVAIATADQQKGTPEKLYHLRVEDAYRKEFWLDLEMRGTAKLGDLDTYLRSIWLECCGHMSEFFAGGPFSRTVAMSRKLGDLFAVGAGLTHIYDMGTSSETIVKCVSVREGKPLTKFKITLMARNQAPEFACMECGKPATYLCMECVYEDDKEGTLCDDHAGDHPHDNYGEPLPLVNSPRTGMCGYTGPANPPY